MSRRTARTIAVAALVMGSVAMAAGVLLRLTSPADPHPDRVVIVGDASALGIAAVREDLEHRIANGGTFEEAHVSPVFLLLALLFLGWMAVGALIVSRQPTNWAGWTFLVVGSLLPLQALSQALVLRGTRFDPGSVPLVGLAAGFGEYVLYPLALVPLLFLLYPDGHVPSPRWRLAVWGLLGGSAMAFLGFLVRPGAYNNWVESGILYVNPLGLHATRAAAGAVIAVGGILTLASSAATVVAVRQRFRRSSGEARQQMRWLAFVAAVAGLTFLALLILSTIGEGILGADGSEPVFGFLFAFLAFTLVIGIPAAYLIAIFRHGLWELDVVIRKTVQYAVLVASFTGIAVLAVIAVPALVFGVGGETGVVPILVVSGMLTMLFQVVRPRARRLADRLVYGSRASPYEVLTAFSGRLGETYSVDDVLPRMAQLVAQATGARRADVWLRVGAIVNPQATWPLDTDPHQERRVVADAMAAGPDEVVAEVRHQGALLGAITLEPAPDDPMDPAKEELVRDLAAQAGLVLRNVGLIEELRASRQRLVAAQDEERRKLERNIHDGAQQQLVALAVQLKLADTLMDKDPAKAHGLLGELQTRSHETLEDLRDLARGIYPPLLADKGLTAALEAQARKAAFPVDVSADGVGRYDQAVEAAVYFCALEALNNVGKYARATIAHVELAQHDGHLTFVVADDGRGFDPAATAYGTGLQGMADRLDAIGGTLTVTSAPADGTAVRGRVPVG